MIDFATIVQILDSMMRLSTPLIFACLAGLFSERAGIFDIGLEGKMLASAFFSAAVAAATGSVVLGLSAGLTASIILALVHGAASITFRGNQLISGVAINFFASGMTALIGQHWFKLGGRTPSLSGESRFLPVEFPFSTSLADVPVVGDLYVELFSGHTLLVYASIPTVFLAWWILFRTRFGLRLRAVGENPESVDTGGLSVARLRYQATLICGLLCGLAGAYLSTGMAAGFIRDMTAGKGYIALAALIFAKWRPGYALVACLLFGFLEAVAIRFQNIEIAGVGTVPLQLMQALPYILTVVILAGFVGKAIPPLAGGVPYNKER